MHLIHVVTLFVVLTLVGVEFSVSAFVNPAAWRLEPASQLKMLSRFALVLGKVMPVWYPVATLLLGVEIWLGWHTPGRALLLAAAVIWVLTSVASIFFLVPLNSRVAEGAADWQQIQAAFRPAVRKQRVRADCRDLFIAEVLFDLCFRGLSGRADWQRTTAQTRC